MNQTLNTPPPSKDDIYRQLERMLGNPDFKASSQQIDFLKFIVDRTLDGNANLIDDQTVATQIFGRGPDFDHSVDPLVSILANLLRRALERYYCTGGKNDLIRISLPDGSYVPEFKTLST